MNNELLSTPGKLTIEYGRIGNKLHQIARHLNERRSPYPDMAKELHNSETNLTVLKFEVLKKVGDALSNIQAYQL